MDAPIVGLIGGSGLGHALAAQVQGAAHPVETPFGLPSAPIVRARWEGVEVAFLARHGNDHTIGPTAVPYRANIYAFKSLGVTHILASGATGSLREEIRPRDLVVPDQVIDRTTGRTATFFDEPGLVAHVEMAQPFCPRLRALLLAAAADVDGTVHDGGTYVCMEGPAFSTAAESRMYRAAGGDLVGMTCMPEAKLAREAEMCYALVALPTDYDSWRPHDPSADKAALLDEIIGNMKEATRHCVQLLQAALRRFAAHAALPCACQDALRLAIWTNRAAVAAKARERLGILVARYFS